MADGKWHHVLGSRIEDFGQVMFGLEIHWGSDKGYQHWNAQWLPGWTPLGQTVADFDGDGHLDLFSPHYHANGARESLPCYLYWGGSDGLKPSRKTILIADSACDALAADFNQDGQIDLAVSCHTQRGNHHTVSKVFYNDGHRFANPKIVELPTVGTHMMFGTDIGHIYDRRYRQTYESSIFQWDTAARDGQFRFKADLPEGTRLEFSVRSAATEQLLEGQAWRPVRQGTFSLRPGDRCLQYRAVFGSDNGDRYPILDKVTIRLRS